MTALVAAAPLAIVLAGMIALRWSAAIAGAVALAAAVALWLAGFGGARLTAGTAAGTAAEAAHATFTILWIILPALALHEFQERTGAVGRIRDALGGLTADRRLQAILIGWFFGLFIEGAAGFGTPVALAAPLLVGLGYPPLRAVVLALLGHAAGVSFGAVGTPALAQIEVSGLDPRSVAAATAMLHALPGALLLLLMVRLAGDRPLSRADLGWSALAALCFFVPSLALARLVGPELPSLGGAMVGAAAFLAFLRRRRPGPAPDLRALLPDLAPYLAILGLVLVSRLVPPLAGALRAPAVDWTFLGTFSGSFEPLYHPGTMLAAGLLAAAWLTGRGGVLAPALVAALRRAAPVALALVVMLALSRTMVHSGMIAALADAAARTGAAWPFVAPAVGVLGSFITGSATASNILFTELQLGAAAALSLPPVAMVAAQSFGAAIGNIVAPHNIIAGSATVGLVGREGAVLRQTTPACIAYAAIGGALTFAIARLA